MYAIGSQEEIVWLCTIDGQEILKQGMICSIMSVEPDCVALQRNKVE
jgi:hypothetical protein